MLTQIRRVVNWICCKLVYLGFARVCRRFLPKTIMLPLCLIETWDKHRHQASATSGSASAYHALSSSLQTMQAYARDHWTIVWYVCSHRSPVHLVANDAGSGVLRQHDDVHSTAAGCAECILVPSFKLAGRCSAYVLSTYYQNSDEWAFNRIWATIRICNEWCFNHVQQFFGSIHLSHGLCANATQVDEYRPLFCFGIYWRVGTVTKLQCTLEFPPPTPLFCWMLPLGSCQTMLRKCNKMNITYLGPVCVCACICETHRLLAERHREIGRE